MSVVTAFPFLSALQAPKKAKKRADGAGSNVFSMFEQTQIQEFKEVGFIRTDSLQNVQISVRCDGNNAATLRRLSLSWTKTGTALSTRTTSETPSPL